MHSCDNRACVNPDHLSIGSYKDNMQDCSRKGRTAKNKGNRHISDEDIREIRKALTKGETQKSIALRFGLSQPAICLINTKKTWSDVL